jgi:uncharacterized protein
LAKIEHLALLADLFGIVLIPPSVYAEVVTRAPNRPGATKVGKADWIQVRTPTDLQKISYLQAELDPGKAEALILAEELGADWVLLDEKKARFTAERLGLRFIGTVGILLLTKRQGKIANLRSLLDELRDKKFHLGDRLYQAVLKQAGKA